MTKTLRTLCLVAVLSTPLRPVQSQDSASKPFCTTTKDEVVRLWCQGGALFLQQNPGAYKKSIEPYSRALTLEKGDEAKVLESLNKAFALRANMIPGETMPDPAADDSFQRFMRSASFVAALKKLPGRSD